MSNKKTTEPTEGTLPPRLVLKPSTQSIITGLFIQKQNLERQIALLEEAFQETIAPLCPENSSEKYNLVSDEKTGVLYLELKPEKDLAATDSNISAFPTQ